MSKISKLFILIPLLFVTAALAHTGVQNATVKARMDSMGKSAASLKVIGLMVKGETQFDATAAQHAAAAIAEHAARTPELFEANESDPKSEAKPIIWENFADFTIKAETLEQTALQWATAITTSDDLTPALRALGAGCKSCHATYRE